MGKKRIIIMAVVVLALVMIIFLIRSCGKKEAIEDDAPPSSKPTVNDDLIEISDINVDPEGCLGSDFAISGHMIVKTDQMSNRIKMSILDKNDEVIKENEEDYLSGDNDFSIRFKPGKEGKQEIKLNMEFRGENVYQNKYIINVKKSKLDFSILNLKSEFKDIKSNKEVTGQFPSLNITNGGECSIENIEYKFELYNKGEQLIHQTEWLSIARRLDLRGSPITIYGGRFYLVMLCLWKPEGTEIGWSEKPEEIEKTGCEQYLTNEEYKLIASVKAKGYESITKEKNINQND